MADYATTEMDAVSVRAQKVLLAGVQFDQTLAADFRFVVAGDDLGAALLAVQPDSVVLDAALATAPVVEILSGPRLAGVPIVLVMTESDGDAAGLLLEQNVIAFVTADAPDAAIAQALLRAGDGMRMADMGAGFNPDTRIASLRRDAERVAAALAELSLDAPAAAARQAVDAPRIRAHIKARRVRERFFAADMFADPGWDILLDLAAARLEGQRVSVSSLCIAATVPTTTGLRWIKTMIDQKMLVRMSDPVDARRAFIAMAPGTETAMTACLEACLNLPGQ